MAKKFNITGSCNPNVHYMVNIDERLREIKVLVDDGAYFEISRGRQYGKTTTLSQLKHYLEKDYIVISLDFQFLTQEAYKGENLFTAAFANHFTRTLRRVSEIDQSLLKPLKECSEGKTCSLSSMFELLSDFCMEAPKPVVLIIDEVDYAGNSQIFVDFLSLLRGYYLRRDEEPIFQSVILAGVYDMKRLQQKIRPDTEHRSHSPWNIAAEFDMDMNLSISGIEGMLREYEEDFHTGMDLAGMAELLYSYTSGYPFIVSKFCKLLDERIAGSEEFPDRTQAWTKEGFLAAEKILLTEKNTLFESLISKLADYPGLREMLHSLLFEGAKISYNSHNQMIDIAAMFGFVKNENGRLVVANRIFEICLYDLFISEEELKSRIFAEGTEERKRFVQGGSLNMDLVLERFMVHWGDLYSSEDEKFIEDNGRKLFLLYLKPIINGVGNYYIESRTRDRGRTDVIVDYRGKQYIIELKIWRGNAYNERGEEQLAGHLDAYHANKGYMVSFNFNKSKVTGIKEIRYGDKVILEVVV